MTHPTTASFTRPASQTGIQSDTPATGQASDHPAAIIRRLSVEWQHRTIRAADLRHVRSWDLPGEDVASLDEVLERCGFVRRQDAEARTGRSGRTWTEPAFEAEYDAYLVRLLVLARTDELAGRIILQRILPALAGVARRRAGSGHVPPDLLDDLVANAWPVIRSYPVERRPRRVVANLVRDISFQTVVRPYRRMSSSEIATSHDRLGEIEAPTPTPTPMHELAELLGEAQQAGVVSAADLDLIRGMIVLGRAEHVAALRGVSPRTVRNHRDAIVHRLRSVAAATAA